MCVLNFFLLLTSSLYNLGLATTTGIFPKQCYQIFSLKILNFLHKKVVQYFFLLEIIEMFDLFEIFERERTA